MTEGLITAILIILFQIYLNSRKKGVNEIVDKIENKVKIKGEILEPPLDIKKIIRRDE